MDRSDALARLATLTAGLAPTLKTTSEDLQRARKALARSLLYHVVDPAVATTSRPATPSHSPSPADLAEFGTLLDEAMAAPATGSVPLVFRRSQPANVLGNPALTPAAVAGMLPESIGPFVDQLGVIHWFDVFAAVQQTAITRVPATTPFLLLPLALPAGPVPTTLPVDAGSLWIEAQLLTPAAPAGGYAGIKISGGSLTFSAAATAGPSGLQVATTTTLTLTVKPDGPTGPLGGGAPGADGGAVITQMPAEVTFVFTQTGASITATSNASLTAYGSTVALQWQPAAPTYEAALGQVLIPFKPQAGSFTPASVLSGLFQPVGTVPIQAGAWGLPVAVAVPAQLGTAATAGQLALVLGPGLRATWQSLAGGPAILGATFLLGAGGVLSLLAPINSANQLGTNIHLWRHAPAPSTARSSMAITFPKGSLLFYTSIASFAGASHVETVSCGASIAAHIDRPLAADGSRLGPTLPGTFAINETATLKDVVVVGQALPGPSPATRIALALHNALLVTTPPTLMEVVGIFTATPTELDTGALLLSFGLETLLPILPDPYAANFLPSQPNANALAPPPSSQLLATVRWSPTTATQLSFSDDSIAAQSLQVVQLPASPAPPPTGQTGQQDQEWRNVLARLFNDSVSSANPTLFLLDLSSNADQLGVGMAVAPPPGDVAPGPVGQVLTISGLDLVAPCLDLRVFTAPAVQWEPVVTIQNPKVLPFPFPSPTGFLDDGGPTLLGAADVTLVPIAPAPLLDQVVSAYDGGTAGAAMFTLPFGMVAVATLPKLPVPTPPLFSRPGLAPVRPAFTPQNMSGGRQVSLTAPATFLNLGGTSAGLPGAAVQLRNLVDQSGNPAKDQAGNQLSVLGPAVDKPFNEEFAAGAPTALIPLTRIDFSGYGASSFSAWADPASDPPSVVQVRFNLMVGRASHEVVQVKSILYPWGAIVVRTITIDRQDDSEIYRYDSGWVAATPGTFDIPKSGITVHPGAVLGAFNIREIRDTTQTFKNGPVELTGVYFDADIQIAGVISGASNGLVSSTGQFGFVQTAPLLTPIGPADLAALITSEGALGGPVDCVIAVAGTAQTMRLSRVEVANAPHGAVAEFAAAARGSLVLPPQGSWSVLTRTDNVSEPTPIDADRGLPLIRQGPAGSPPGNTPWRLAEPADLWAPVPSVDYCLLHATDSTRMLFPRPKVESGANAFTSTQVPLLTDGFGLMAATGICPRQDACLTFPNANYALQISGDSAFTLAGVPDPFAPSLPSRTLASGAGGAIGFEYANETGVPCEVSVAIQPNSWAVGLRGVNVRLDMTPFSGLMRAVGDVQAASGSGVSFGNARVVLGSVLQPLQDLISFFDKLGLPDPFQLSFSNSGWTPTKSYKLQAGVRFDTDTFNLLPPPDEIELKLGFGNAAKSRDVFTASSSQWVGSLEFKIVWQLPWPPPPLAWVGIFKLDVAFPAGTTPGTEVIKLQLGVCYSVKGDLIKNVLELEASFAAVLTLVVITTTHPASISVGIGVILEASGKILDGFANIHFTVEADALLIFQPTPISAEFDFDLQLDVTVCWCVNITFEIETQYTAQLS